jgi:hypothetical protein
MIKPESIDSVWKLIAITLVSATVTGVSSWLLFGLSRVSHADMSEYVEEKIKISSFEEQQARQPLILRLELISTKQDMMMDKVKSIERMLNKNEQANLNVKPNQIH